MKHTLSKTSLLIVAFLSVISEAMSAELTLVIQKAPEMSPVSGAWVSLRRPDGGRELFGTDTQGMARFGNRPGGTYSVSVFANGNRIEIPSIRVESFPIIHRIVIEGPMLSNEEFGAQMADASQAYYNEILPHLPPMVTPGTPPASPIPPSSYPSEDACEIANPLWECDYSPSAGGYVPVEYLGGPAPTPTPRPCGTYTNGQTWIDTSQTITRPEVCPAHHTGSRNEVLRVHQPKRCLNGTIVNNGDPTLTHIGYQNDTCLDRTIIGVIDGILTTSGGQHILRGWACSKNTAQSIPVHLYAMGPAGTGQPVTGTAVANRPSEPLISLACGTSGVNHRFEIDITPWAASRSGQSIWVHGISPHGFANLPIADSGRFAFKPLVGPPSPPRILSPSNPTHFPPSKTSVTVRWDPVPGITRYLLRAVNTLGQSVVYEDNYSGTSYTMNVTPGVGYTFWMHAATNGYPTQQNSWSPAVLVNFAINPATNVIPNGRYRLRSVHSGKCLDVQNDSRADGGLMQQWACAAAAQGNQLWNVTSVGPGMYRLVGYNSGKCLDIDTTPGTHTNGAKAHQWACAGTANQTFTVVPSYRTPGAYKLRPAHNGKCLDVYLPNANSDGAKVQNWDCNPETDQTNQVWRFESR